MDFRTCQRWYNQSTEMVKKFHPYLNISEPFDKDLNRIFNVCFHCKYLHLRSDTSVFFFCVTARGYFFQEQIWNWIFDFKKWIKRNCWMEMEWWPSSFSNNNGTKLSNALLRQTILKVSCHFKFVHAFSALQCVFRFAVHFWSDYLVWAKEAMKRMLKFDV